MDGPWLHFISAGALLQNRAWKSGDTLHFPNTFFALFLATARQRGVELKAWTSWKPLIGRLWPCHFFRWFSPKFSRYSWRQKWSKLTDRSNPLEGLAQPGPSWNVYKKRGLFDVVLHPRLQHNTYKHNLSSKSLKTCTQNLAASIYKPFHPFLKASLSYTNDKDRRYPLSLGQGQTNKPSLGQVSLQQKQGLLFLSLYQAMALLNPSLSRLFLALSLTLSTGHSFRHSGSHCPSGILANKSSSPLLYNTLLCIICFFVGFFFSAFSFCPYANSPTTVRIKGTTPPLTPNHWCLQTNHLSWERPATKLTPMQ